MSAWQQVTALLDPFLDTLTTEHLSTIVYTNDQGVVFTPGVVIQRTMYHYWYHLGENMAIRQMLGHADLPEFVGNIEREAPYHPPSTVGRHVSSTQTVATAMLEDIRSVHDREARQRQLLERVRQRAARRFPLHELTLPVAGAPHPYIIAMPADPDGPLDQLAAWQTRSRRNPTEAYARSARQPASGAAEDALRAVFSGIHLPYWALLWPSGIALAEAILAAPSLVAGKRVLELGCGLGVTASTALRAGANLIAADCFADALLFCRLNTLRNAGRVPSPLLIDWRTPAGREACLARAPFDAVLAADVLYEAEDEAPLLELVPRLLVPGGIFALAEPGRRVALSFVAAALACGWHDEPTTHERVWPTDTKSTRVTVHRFTLPG